MSHVKCSEASNASMLEETCAMYNHIGLQLETSHFWIGPECEGQSQQHLFEQAVGR